MSPPPQQIHLAQVNIGRLRHAVGSPELREFTAALARINGLADRSPGFVWRYPTAEGHLGGGELFSDPLIFVNLSVWQSYELLHDFTYRSSHGHYVRRRREWFLRMPSPATALWWLPADARPTPAQALTRLRHLRQYGSTPQAFTPRHRFGPNGRSEPRGKRRPQLGSRPHQRSAG